MGFTDTGVKNEVIEHLDFDFDVPCEMEEPVACTNVAEWRFEKSCCAAVRLYCSPCKDLIFESFESLGGFPSSCILCGGVTEYGPRLYRSVTQI